MHRYMFYLTSFIMVLAGLKELNVMIQNKGQPLQFYINVTYPPTDDVRVRRALLYATDRQTIVQTVFMGLSPAAHGPLSRVTWSYADNLDALYPFDPQQAAQLLDQAGWHDGDGDGIRERDGQPLVLQAVLMSWGFVPEVAQMLQAQWRQVGVQLELQLLAYAAAVQAAADGQYHLIPFTFSGSDPHVLYAAFHSANADGGFNWSHIRDADLDRLLEQGMASLSESERRAAYVEVQQRIMAQALILPIRDYVNLNVVSARVRGLCYDAQGWFPWLYDVSVE